MGNFRLSALAMALASVTRLYMSSPELIALLNPLEFELSMANSSWCLLVVALLFGVLFLPPVIATTSRMAAPNEEREALLHSGWWSDYRNISNHCEWEGIRCNEVGSVTEIWAQPSLNISVSQLRFQNLNVTAFPNLVTLYLYGMGLTGSIPTEISALTKLTMLHLSANRLQGKVLQTISKITQLEELYVSENSLSGVIPSTLGRLENLTVLSLGSNQLTGPIPVELGNLKRLTLLYLPNNSLTGSIPSSLGQLKNLTSLYLDSNQIKGSIPVELGNLNLTTLFLSENFLTGSIPSTLGQLENLSYLYLDSNQIEGPIPVEIWNLKYLQVFRTWNSDIGCGLGSRMDPTFMLWLEYESECWEWCGELGLSLIWTVGGVPARDSNA